jgi:hypothetical protein
LWSIFLYTCAYYSRCCYTFYLDRLGRDLPRKICGASFILFVLLPVVSHEDMHARYFRQRPYTHSKSATSWLGGCCANCLFLCDASEFPPAARKARVLICCIKTSLPLPLLQNKTIKAPNPQDCLIWTLDEFGSVWFLISEYRRRPN